MSNFILHDHTGCNIYYSIDEDCLVRGGGLLSSPNVVPVYYNGSILYVLHEGHTKFLKSYIVRQEILIGGIEKISISKEGFFGAAEEGRWEIVFSRENVDAWEMYTCSETFFENSLYELMQDKWLSTDYSILYSKSSIKNNGNGFLISDRYYDTLENRKNLNTLPYHDREITLMRGIYTERYIKFNPLIYFVVFGSDEQRESVTISIESLIVIGKYSGDFCIITDRDDMNTILPKDYPGKLHIIRSVAHSRIEMWKARYQIGEMFPVQRYQPILYMDTDVICNDLIDPFLCKILVSNSVCVGTENHPGVVIIPSQYRSSDAVGKSFFEADGFYPEAEYGFNSGIIGLPNIETGRAVFAAVTSIIKKMIHLNVTKGWVDQAVLNYVLHKYNCVDDKTLSSEIAVGTGEEIFPYKDSSLNPVLIHFWSTHAHERLNRLKDYVKRRSEKIKAI